MNKFNPLYMLQRHTAASRFDRLPQTGSAPLTRSHDIITLRASLAKRSLHSGTRLSYAVTATDYRSWQKPFSRAPLASPLRETIAVARAFDKWRLTLAVESAARRPAR